MSLSLRAVRRNLGVARGTDIASSPPAPRNDREALHGRKELVVDSVAEAYLALLVICLGPLTGLASVGQKKIGQCEPNHRLSRRRYPYAGEENRFPE
jgi:hypothetical protein